MKHIARNGMAAVSAAALLVSLAACGEEDVEAVGAYDPAAGVQMETSSQRQVNEAERYTEPSVVGEDDLEVGQRESGLDRERGLAANRVERDE